jgi:hypothetical protein
MTEHSREPLIEYHKAVEGHHREHVLVNAEGYAQIVRVATRANWLGDPNNLEARYFAMPIYVSTDDLEPCPCYVRWPR